MKPEVGTVVRVHGLPDDIVGIANGDVGVIASFAASRTELYAYKVWINWVADVHTQWRNGSWGWPHSKLEVVDGEAQG